MFHCNIIQFMLIFTESLYALKVVPGMAEHTCIRSTWQVEAEGSQLQGQSELYTMS